MAWPPDDAVSRRDDALHRTRRISLGTAGGALAATAALGFAFARALPGHSAVTATTSPATGGASGQAAYGAGAGPPSTSPHPTRSHTRNTRTGSPASQAPSQPPPAPAPTSAAPQVVSGGS